LFKPRRNTGEAEVQLHSFLTPELDAGITGEKNVPNALPPGGGCDRYPSNRRLGGPIAGKNVLGGQKKKSLVFVGIIMLDLEL
jgi:hypothetical protein